MTRTISALKSCASIRRLCSRCLSSRPASRSGRDGSGIYTLVPREWELRLLEAKRISTYRLAIELLYLHWYGKGKPVTVSSKVAQAAKISARSKWEALAELERLGLIEVDRRPRRSPRVVLLHTQATQIMSAIAHSHMRAIAPKILRQHVRDRAQGVPILFSCSLN